MPTWCVPPPPEGGAPMDLQIIRTRHPPEPFLPQIANLIEQAGLPATPEDVGRRLERLPAADRLILAGEGEQLIGYAHLRIGNDLVYEETAELMSIIVRASHRRRGIGRRLVTAAETWAAQSGRARLLMRTEVVRTAALRAGRVHALGTTAAVEAATDRTTERIDLGGRTVLPGLIDAHLHLQQ